MSKTVPYYGPIGSRMPVLYDARGVKIETRGLGFVKVDAMALLEPEEALEVAAALASAAMDAAIDKTRRTVCEALSRDP